MANRSSENLRKIAQESLLSNIPSRALAAAVQGEQGGAASGKLLSNQLEEQLVGCVMAAAMAPN